MKTPQAIHSEAKLINGIDVKALTNAVSEVVQDSSKAMTRWHVTTSWKGGAQTETQVDGYEIGGQYVARKFQIHTDEPFELCGSNLNANPQETLLAALNACMMVGYVSLCAMEGIELEDLRIETKGDIDLRGFFGLDPKVIPGYGELRFTVHIKGNGTQEQFRKIHEKVRATSPNYYNISNPIRLKGELVVES